MRNFASMALAGLIGAGALALGASTASAAIVCNDDGDCWHTKTTYTYPPSVKLHVHEDNWKWGDGDKMRWREHEGRGYWHGGDWKDF